MHWALYFAGVLAGFPLPPSSAHCSCIDEWGPSTAPPPPVPSRGGGARRAAQHHRQSILVEAPPQLRADTSPGSYGHGDREDSGHHNGHSPHETSPPVSPGAPPKLVVAIVDRKSVV